MELFSCNNCKRCRRRTPSAGDDEHDTAERRRHGGTNSRRERRRSVNDCCAAAATYFHAGVGDRRRRRPEGEVAPLESLELRAATAAGRGGGGTRTSILKKPDDSPMSAASTAVGGAGRSPSVADKRASFNEAVDVVIEDDSGRPVVADSVRLKRSPPRLNAAAAVARATTNERRPAKQAFAKMVFPPASRCRHAFQLASTDVERRPDGSRYLRAVIRPATNCDGGDENNDERVIVRAAGRGSRLVVGAYRPAPLGDGTNYLRQVMVISIELSFSVHCA